MTEHYGQHPVCAACDAAATANSPRAKRAAQKRSDLAAYARQRAREEGRDTSEADRLAAYATSHWQETGEEDAACYDHAVAEQEKRRLL